MFKNLRTGTKLFVLCGVFIISIGLTVYSLVAEKQIAIDFARKELVGTGYLAAVRAIYAALTDPASDTPSEQPKMSPDDLLKTLAKAEAGSAAVLKTAELEKALAATLGQLWSNKAEGTSPKCNCLGCPG